MNLASRLLWKGGSRVRVTGCRRERNYWEETGWRYSGYYLVGYYRTYRGSYRGEIELFQSGRHQYYVFNPPPQLWSHEHGTCFRPRGNGKYWVHFNIEPRNVDAGIVTIERILREALERH